MRTSFESDPFSSTNGTALQSNGSALLDSFMIYLPEGGLDFERFVEQGGHLVGRERIEMLMEDLLGLNEKVEELRTAFPRLSGQVELLADFVVQSGPNIPARVRNEAIFALIYCAKDCDLIPDWLPGIGFSDDAIVAELVLRRNAELLERHCRARGFDWAALV
jgi:uncharacterized membrane protein YkvA (DUF1232 family)